MDVVIRSCRPDEMEAYGRLVGYVFAVNDPEVMRREVALVKPEWTHCAFVDGVLSATMGVIPFTVQLNGKPATVGGVTAVGTLAEWRRKGLLRQVMTSGLEKARGEGQGLVMLWASMGAIYQRFGYGLASRYVRYEFDPRNAALEGPVTASGACCLTPREEAEPVARKLHEAYIAPRNLCIHRSQQMWEDVFREKPDEPKYTAIYRDGTGTPRGYMVYRTREIETVGPSQEMRVSDFIALDVDAFRGLWGYILRHDLVGSVKMHAIVAEDDPAPDLLSEPRLLNRWTGDGIWLRVVDVEMGLPQRGYDEPGRLTFAIEGDDACPWNNGTWALEVDEGQARVSRTEEPATMTMPVNTLAGLLTGFQAASHYERIGRLSCDDPAALRLADRMFATAYRPFTPDEF